MIRLSGLKETQGRLVRETVAPFVLDDGDGEQTETIRVRYYALSIAESAEYREQLKKLGDEALWTDILLPVIESLPDFVDDKDKPVKVTRDLLASINVINLQAINTAIGEDLSRPKSRPKLPPTG